MSCRWCVLVKSALGEPVYRVTDQYVITEDLHLSVPILIARHHVPQVDVLSAAKHLKEVATKLYGPYFGLFYSHPDLNSHFWIKVLRRPVPQNKMSNTPVLCYA